jgi:LuxR family maltose regulon positive regulatory protein
MREDGSIMAGVDERPDITPKAHGTTIHASRLHQPRPRADWIARERLLTLLDRGLQVGRRVILVSASAGAGKTTLLGHWLAARQLQAAWLSLEPEDDEPARFWISVLHALQRAAPGVGQWALDALTSPAPPPLSSLLPGLLGEISGRDQPLVLALDDYHLLTAKGIHESIETVVQHLPERLRLVICTRADPPLPLARWRARDELVEVRAGDLRFTVDEALAFLNQRMALNLRAEDAEQLVTRTEGWAVGLQLAGLSLQGQADPHKAIQTLAGSRHFVLEYLIQEVLAHQPEATQRFLLHTALLNRMCGPLCDAVTGEQGGAQTLLDLQRQNLFVVPLDDERYWYRYHHLFAELLRARLQQVAAQQARSVHAAASLWYAENDMVAEALHHALAGQDWARAAQLLEAREHDWWTGSDMAMVTLIRQLPDEVILRGPNLAVYKAWFLLVSGQLQMASALLNHIEHTVGGAERDDDHRGLLSFVAMQQAYIAEITESATPRRVDAGSLAHVSERRGGMRNSAEVILAVKSTNILTFQLGWHKVAVVSMIPQPSQGAVR